MKDDLATFVMYFLAYFGIDIFLFGLGFLIIYLIYTLNAEAVNVLGNFFK